MPEKPAQKKRSQGRLVLAGILVGAVAYLLWKRKQAAKASQSADTIGTLPSAMPAGADSSTTTIGGTPGLPHFTSVTDWSEHIQQWGNSLGFDAATVQNALQHYQTGQCLTASEYHIINLALGLFGQPPGAPYQGVVQCNGTGAGPADQTFLGSGYGPPGYDPKQASPTGTLLTPPTKDETQVLKGLDGSCYAWIPGTQADKAIGSDQTRYLEVAPGVFVPDVNPVPGGTAALYLKVPCPVASGGG